MSRGLVWFPHAKFWTASQWAPAIDDSHAPPDDISLVFKSIHLLHHNPAKHPIHQRIMSAQGVVDAVKDGVNQVAEKLQGTNVEDSANTSEAKPAETKPQTLLDEVTGEYVSKSELKKRQKQRQKDIEKAKKESTRQAPPAPKKKNAADDEAQLNPNVSRKSRH